MQILRVVVAVVLASSCTDGRVDALTGDVVPEMQRRIRELERKVVELERKADDQRRGPPLQPGAGSGSATKE